jgi:formimidoylglutamate deiminase
MEKTNWLPDLIYSAGKFQSGVALTCDDGGQISRVAKSDEPDSAIKLHNRALLPGLVNAHSHAFQRVIRGRTEYRSTNENDSFWTWREMMYSAAARLTPEDIYDASRMAFLEMALNGITCVGEFHYLHNAPDGRPYADANFLAKQVVRAAHDVGLRIALLRVAYARSGHDTESNSRQGRFIESDPEVYLKNLERLIGDLEEASSKERGQAPFPTANSFPTAGSFQTANSSRSSWAGVAPHSVRAVPLPYLRQVIDFANERQLPVHMHVAEQPAEVSACIQEYGRSPVALLETEGLLGERFTGVHVIHVTPKAIGMLARSGAMVCACPTTERNLGDGTIPVDNFFAENVRVALGTDSHVEIDLLEDARELEYHLRLQRLERAVLDRSVARNERQTRDSGGPPSGAELSGLAARLFDCATLNGAASLGAPGGALDRGRPADFFTVDLNDPSIAGASEDDLLPSIVFSLSRTAIKDVVVGGKRIVEDGRHAQQEEIVERFKALQKKLWS